MDNNIDNNLECFVIRSNEIESVNWSGGSTKELFIYPKNAKYINRDFEFRLSNATIDAQISEFTYLPNYYRLIMPLDNTIYLSFNENEREEIKPLTVKSFLGKTKTICYNSCKDLNIMTNENWQASMSLIEEKNIKTNDFCFIFPLTDIKALNFNLKIGDLLVIIGKGEFNLNVNKNDGVIVKLKRLN